VLGWGVLVAVLVGLTGCFSLERDAGAFYTWSKRGQVAGEMLRLYCQQGSGWERAHFLAAYREQAGAAAGTLIFCSTDPVGAPPPPVLKP
jgi:hypothetical protein